MSERPCEERIIKMILLLMAIIGLCFLGILVSYSIFILLLMRIESKIERKPMLAIVETNVNIDLVA